MNYLYPVTFSQLFKAGIVCLQERQGFKSLAGDAVCARPISHIPSRWRRKKNRNF